MSTTPATPGPYSGTSIPATTPAARPQAAEIAELKEERDELDKDLSALLRVLDAHDVTEGVETARDTKRRLQAAEHINEGYRAMEQKLEEAQAELAALRQPIQSDAGISLGQVAFEAFCPGNTRSYLNYLKVPWESAAQAVAAVVEALMIRRMEAVPVEELRRVYHPRRSISEGLETVRARFIAAAKGDGQAQAKPSTRVEITEIPDKQPGPVGTLAYAPQPVVVNEPPKNEEQPDLSGESERQDLGAMVKAAREAAIKGLTGPAWIPHDGGPCPLKDEEVEEFEFRIRDGKVSGNVFVPSGWRWSNDGTTGDIIAYRVLKWKPGHGPEAKAEPATFEAHGKVWTRHTPGDPMPCDGKDFIFILNLKGEPTHESGYVYEKRPARVTNWSNVSAWLYADEPSKAQQDAAEAKPEPAQPWTPAVGDTVRLKSGGPVMTVCCLTPEGATGCAWFDDGGCLDTKAFPAACLTPAKEGQP
jgi:uncharacterized protein YodC (DUF2158 family)